jgi:hypothetical protein
VVLAGVYMELKNLRRNILDVLGDRFVQRGDAGPYPASDIFGHFADLPRESIRTALEELRQAGFLSAGDVREHLMLTERGLNQIAIFKKTD